MKFITSLILFCSITNPFTVAAQERTVKKIGNEKFNKFALVIGNSNYKCARSLKNSTNDTEGMK